MNSEILAEMDEDFTQEKQILNTNNADKTEDFTNDSAARFGSEFDSNMDISMNGENKNRIFQFSGFTNEVR